MEIENRCPHGIAVSGPDGHQRVIKPTAPAVRIETTPGAAVGSVEGIPIHAPPGWNGITNLPPRRDGVTIVVSQIVALAISALLPDRDDIVYPGTAPKDGASRGEKGVMSISRLIRAV